MFRLTKFDSVRQQTARQKALALSSAMSGIKADVDHPWLIEAENFQEG
jgi:hypothetical protein